MFTKFTGTLLFCMCIISTAQAASEWVIFTGSGQISNLTTGTDDQGNERAICQFYKSGYSYTNFHGLGFVQNRGSGYKCYASVGNDKKIIWENGVEWGTSHFRVLPKLHTQGDWIWWEEGRKDYVLGTFEDNTQQFICQANTSDYTKFHGLGMVRWYGGKFSCVGSKQGKITWAPNGNPWSTSSFKVLQSSCYYGEITSRNCWLGKAQDRQNLVDLNSPISQSSILGTHNSYNSNEYADDGYARYFDPQQLGTIKEQLYMGARFIELDLHWALNASNWRYHLLLCHGGACSLSDRFFTEGLTEIRQWLDSSDSDNQVLILYLEDHSANVHDQMYTQLMDKVGDYIYKSNGCRSVPSDLTKADVLNAGAKVIVWKDSHDGNDLCSSHEGLKNTVFTGLSNISRVWEDRTVIGDLFGGVNPDTDYISAQGVKDFHKAGINIVNLDDMTYNDGRNAAGVWSWWENEPNGNTGENCAAQVESSHSNSAARGRWVDLPCSRSYKYACRQSGTNNWIVTSQAGSWSNGSVVCASQGYEFSVPTNSYDNDQLVNAANGARVWINHNDIAEEGLWVTP